ncbi:BREX-4 system phosphatase PglZ [Methanococcus maripaludis]|uniref:DUF7863 domain-containing protein n=1 Tax=Methanococcus maripaludis TaxID=39152 RepID=A0A7J9S1U2_METMI|nr:BREX-4 system phosphatase PglZ [Methanococcus maripaludis]MBB6067914.1 hypothetical protein [Methanococcus maripaludis]
MSKTVLEEYRDIECLYDAISKDLNSKEYLANRFSLRFIFVPDFDHMAKLCNYLTKSMNLKEINVSKMLPHDDGQVTPQRIVETIKNEDKNLLITSLSEISRFYGEDDFLSLFLDLAYIEKKNKIYVPVVGIYERFRNEVMPVFSRSNESAPIWALSLQDITPNQIFIPKFEYDFKSNDQYHVVKNVRDWINLWNNQSITKNIVCTSRFILHSHENVFPDYFFKFNILDNQKEFLRQVYNINIPVEYKPEDNMHWNEIIKKINNDPKIDTIKKIILESTNKRKISDNEVFDIWINENIDETVRWMLKHYVLLNDSSDSYIKRVLSSTYDYSPKGLENLIWEKILEIPVDTMVFKEMANERKEYLIKFYEKYPGKDVDNRLIEKLNEKINQQSKLSDKLAYLTNSTYYEKEQIFKILGNYCNDMENTDGILEDIAFCYPELYYYLKAVDESDENSWIEEYFREYRWARVLNNPEKIKNLINIHNNNAESFYKWYSPFKNIHSEDVSKYGKSVWIDALGLEWISLITNIIKNDYPNISIETEVDYSALPTTTEYNLFDFENMEKNKELDNYVHSQNAYSHPKSLIDELDIINKLFRRLCNNLKENVLIVSDHGFTSFSTRQHSEVAAAKIEDTGHSGRYGWVNEDFNTHEVITHKHSDGKRVALCLKHNTLNKTPRKEVHGGATPEEVIVPIIRLSKNKNGKLSKNKPVQENNEYEIRLQNDIINTKDKISLEITPWPKSVKLKDQDDNEYILDYSDESFWNLQNPEKKASVVTYAVVIDGNIIKNIEINTKGFIEKDLGI